MNRLYTILLSIVISALVWTSCYDDKGNYDYTDFTKTEIKGIEKEYARISFRDTLYIDPEITPHAENYEYLWVINPAYEKMPSSGGIDSDTIGHEKKLAYPVKLAKGLYDLTLKVTDKTTQYAVFSQTTLVAQTEFSLGFYVLKETEGNTEVDLHLPDGGIADNLIAKSTGQPQTGTPIGMGLVFQYCYMNDEGKYESPTALTVCTNKDVQIFNLQDMNVILSHENLFFGEVPAAETPYYLYPNAFGIAYASDKGMYFNMQYATQGMNSAGKFGYPLPVDDIKADCRPNRNIIFDGIKEQSIGLSYLFDEANHRFLAFDFNGTYKIFDENDADSRPGKYSPNEIPENYELKFFGRNAIGNNHYGYALFEDKSSGKNYLYTLALTTDPSTYFNPITDVTEIPASLELNKASLYAMNEEDARLIYYVADNRLYRYDIEEGLETPMTLEGMGNGEITYISNRYWKQDNDPENNFNSLAIGTYQDGNYRIDLYDMLGGIPKGTPRQSLKGKGKAVKLQFSSPKMLDNPTSSLYYPVSF